jgi:hypothetical protein
VVLCVVLPRPVETSFTLADPVALPCWNEARNFLSLLIFGIPSLQSSPFRLCVLLNGSGSITDAKSLASRFFHFQSCLLMTSEKCDLGSHTGSHISQVKSKIALVGVSSCIMETDVQAFNALCQALQCNDNQL